MGQRRVHGGSRRTGTMGVTPGNKNIQPTRLYVKGVMMGFKRGLRNQYEHTSILKIQNVQDKKATEFYLGKRVCFIYKAQKEIRGSKFRTIWGRDSSARLKRVGQGQVPAQPAAQGHGRTSARDALPLAQLKRFVASWCHTCARTVRCRQRVCVTSGVAKVAVFRDKERRAP